MFFFQLLTLNGELTFFPTICSGIYTYIYFFFFVILFLYGFKQKSCKNSAKNFFYIIYSNYQLFTFFPIYYFTCSLSVYGLCVCVFFLIFGWLALSVSETGGIKISHWGVPWWLSGLRIQQSLLWLGLLLWYGFNPWPRNLCMPQARPKKIKKKISHCSCGFVNFFLVILIVLLSYILAGTLNFTIMSSL